MHGIEPSGSIKGRGFLDFLRLASQEGLCSMELAQHSPGVTERNHEKP
jgi:hypothetical protein